MSKIRIVVLVSISFLVLLLGYREVAFKEDTLEEKETIRIGGIFAQTGKWADTGITQANFVHLAIDEINTNGGILGRQVEFILEDDMCSSIAATSAVRKLIYEDNISFILGPSCTPASTPVAPIAQQTQAFVLAATTTAKDIFDNYSFAFRVSPEATQAASLIAELSYKKYNIRKVAILVEQTDFSQSWSEAFSERLVSLGGEVILIESLVSETWDHKTSLTKISELDVDAVFVSTQTENTAALIYRQMNELGIDLQIVGTPTTVSLEVFRLSNDVLPKNAFTIVPYTENEELYQKYVKEYDAKPGFEFFYTAAMYDAMYMLKEALEICYLDSTCVRDYFYEINYQGEVGEWSFDEDGDPILKEVYAELKIVGLNKSYEKVQLS